MSALDGTIDFPNLDVLVKDAVQAHSHFTYNVLL